MTAGSLQLDAFELLTDGVMVLDSKWRITYLNAAAVRLTGLDANESLGRSHWEVFPASADSEVYRGLHSAATHRNSVRFDDYYAPRKRWFHVKAYPAPDDGLLVIYEDITHRKDGEDDRSELLRREREARQEAETLNQLARILSGELDLEKLLRAATEATCEGIAAEWGSFCSDSPRYAAATPQYSHLQAVWAGRKAADAGTIRIDDLPQHSKGEPSRVQNGAIGGTPHLRSYLSVPIVSRSGELFGALCFGHSQPNAFNQRSERIAGGVAAHAALAIDNARLLETAQNEIARRKQAEEQRARTETHFQRMIEAIPAAIYTTDAEGRLTHFNSAAANLLGRTPQLGTERWSAAWKIFLPDGTPVPHDQCPMAQTVKQGLTVQGGEYIAERPDGSRFWFTPYPTPLIDESGRCLGGINMLVDVTARKVAEEALRASEERFRGVFNSSAIGVAVLKLDGSFLQANNAFSTVTGYTEQELKARDWQAITHPDDRQELQQCIRELLAGSIPTFVLEQRCLAGNGRTVWLQSSVSLMSDAAGQPQNVLILCEDVTARLQVEEALRESEERFRTITETTPECVKLVASDGTLLQINSSGLGMLGASDADNLIGKNVCDLIAPEHRDAYRAFNERVCNGEKGSLEFEIINLLGVRRHMESHAVPLHHSDGRTVQLGIARDITERKQAERAVLLLGAIVDSSDDAIISKNLDGIITSWNKSAQRLFGYTAEEIVGKSVTLLIPPDRLGEEPKIIERLKRGERVDHFETIRRRKDGSLLDISLTISPVKNARGTIIGASKIARDISDRKHVERAGLLLSAIVDSSDDAIISKNLNGVITSWNQSAQRVFGYTAEEAIGRPVTMLIPPDRLQEEPRILDRLKRGERVDHFETIRRRKDGTLLDISLTISPVRDSTGTVIGASKIARDITDRKRAEAALLESEARFRQLADSMPQIVWTADANGSFDYLNQRWFSFTGFTPEDAHQSAWASALHREDREQFIAGWRDCVNTGQPFSLEHRLWDLRESRFRWFMSRAVPIHDNGGSVTKWFGTTTDIDTQKRVEQDLRHANGDLEQFAYSASHDLQEPLRSVKIYSELLTRRYGHKLEGPGIEYCEFVRTGAARMEVLVRDLLAYTQVSKSEEYCDPVDANEPLREALANLNESIVESGADIRVGPLPELRVPFANLRQLFQNLVGNAIKYRSPQRKPVIDISARQQNDMWTFSIRDNGIGIETQYKEQIFGLFKRLHTREEYAGTGIGLAICQRIVERSHGRIWVESQPGEGSTFLFTLPV